jgi:hypothetical protein
MAYGDAFPVSDYQGIDADTSPLKMRACFNVDWDYFPTEEYKDEATPLRAPRFFKCFDAEQITEDLQSGDATAILADENRPYGFNTYITQYPDGRAYMWRQINKCGEAQFSGSDLPEGCPSPTAAEKTSANAISEPDEEKVTTGINLLPYAATQAEPIQVDGLIAVAKQADPLSFHGCFTTPLSFGLLTETYQTYEPPMPAASNLPCFQSVKLQADLIEGVALAFIGDQNIHPGIDRVIAVYEDGRAFAWHQKTRSE